MPRGFVRVTTVPDVYDLEATSSWGPGICIYPQEDSWGSFKSDPDFEEKIAQALLNEDKGRIFVVMGPPGTGKTFHLLLLGHQWENSGGGGLFGRGERRAWYAMAAEVDPPEVGEQWNDNANAEALWIIDDMHSNMSTSQTLIRLYDEYDLAERRHSLLFGCTVCAYPCWTLPKGIQENVSVFQLPLKRQVIEYALEARNLGVPSQEVLDELAKTPLVGLRQILALPEIALREPQRLQSRALQETLERVQDPQESKRLRQLTRLRLIGVRLGPVDFPGLPRELQQLVSRGFAVQISEETPFFELSDDELARALLADDLVTTADSQLLQEFLDPLKEVSYEFLERASLGFVAQLLIGLRDHAITDLREWIGRTGQDGAASLLSGLMEDDSFTQALGNVLERRDTSLYDIGRTFHGLSHLTPIPAWAGQAAAGVVQQRFEDIRCSISERGDLDAWRSAEVLSRITDHTGLKSVLTAAFESQAFCDSLSAAPSARRAPFLTQLESFSPALFKRTMCSLLPVFRQELAAARDPSSFWRQLNSLARKDGEVAAGALAGVDTVQIIDEVLKAPQGALKFLSVFHPKKSLDIRRRVIGKLRKSLEGVMPSEQDSAEWSSPYDVVGLVFLATELRLPQLAEADVVQQAAADLLDQERRSPISQLCSRVAKYRGLKDLRAAICDKLEQTILDGREPINLRLFLLTKLDRARAVPLAEVVLDRFREVPAGPTILFDALWNAAVAFGSREHPALREAVRRTVDSWDDIVASSPRVLTLIALAGLCAFVYGGKPPRVSLGGQPEPPSELEPFSPRLTVCQVHALAPAGVAARSHEARLLKCALGGLQNPSSEFNRRWHGLEPKARRMALRILGDALEALDRRAWTRKLAREVTSTISSRETDYWDDYAQLCLDYVRRFNGDEVASELIVQRGDRWAKKVVPRLPVEALLPFAQTVCEVASGNPTCGSQAEGLTAAALKRLDVRSDVRTQLWQLRDALQNKTGS